MKHIKWTEDWFKELEEGPFYPLQEFPKIAIDYIRRVEPLIVEEAGIRSMNIFVMGTSGAYLAGMLTTILPSFYNTKVLQVRKKGEMGHFISELNPIKGGYNIILDDFMRSGNTINRIYEKIKGDIDHVDMLVIGNKFDDRHRSEPWPLKFNPKVLICDSTYVPWVEPVKPTTSHG